MSTKKAIVQQGLLLQIHLQPMDWTLTLVLLEQGDTLLFRGDIPHVAFDTINWDEKKGKFSIGNY